jgi:hypothetical protein
MRKKKISNEKKRSDIKIVYASKSEVEIATKKCLKKYPDVFKELAKR